MNKPMETKKLVAAISLIPESAPFDEAQRAWLNGFFAGMTGIEEMMARGGSASVAQLETAEPEIEEDFPWHDDALAIVHPVERKPPKRLKSSSKLGETRCPPRRRRPLLPPLLRERHARTPSPPN